jgi:hypothetical protein
MQKMSKVIVDNVLRDNVFTDSQETGFAPGPDRRKTTITYDQAMVVMQVLNNLGIYGEVYVNQEGLGPAGFVLPDPSDKSELIYVLFYNGNYHGLAEVAIFLDKTPKTEVVRSIYNTLGVFGQNILNIPAVARAAEAELKKLFVS